MKRRKFVPPANVTITSQTDSLVSWLLPKLRDPRTDTPTFRQALDDMSILLLHNLCAHLPSRGIRVRTPLKVTVGAQAPAGRIIIVPVLRAGDPMVNSLFRVIPGLASHHIGIKRIEPDGRQNKFRWEIYYEKKPPRPETVTRCFVLEPMVARGGSSCAALKRIKEWGIPPVAITLVSIFAAPKGIRALHREHPDIPVVVAVIDPKLNRKSYIVGGCGDAGCRANGTVWKD